MRTIDKGEVAQQKTILRALEKGFIVSKPVFDNQRYDLILDDHSKLYRVQVKWCDAETPNSENAYTIELKRHNGSRGIRKIRTYSDDEIDIVIVYFPTLEKIVWLPPLLWIGKMHLTMRFLSPKNNQKNVFMIDDYLW